MYNQWAQLQVSICTRAQRAQVFLYMWAQRAQAILELRNDIQAPNFKCESFMQAQLLEKHFQA